MYKSTDCINGTMINSYRGRPLRFKENRFVAAGEACKTLGTTYRNGRIFTPESLQELEELTKINIDGLDFGESSFWTGFTIKNISSKRFPPQLTSHTSIDLNGDFVAEIDLGLALSSRKDFSEMFSHRSERAFRLGLVHRRNATQIRIKNGRFFFTAPRLKSYSAARVNIMISNLI